MLSGPRKLFCDGIVAGKSATEAYCAAYPRATSESARKHAARLKAQADVREEIERMRKLAEEKAGAAIMQLFEKRKFLARVVRARVGSLGENSDLLQSIRRGKNIVEWKLPDKIAAIQLDNKMAGQGEADGADDSIAKLIRSCMR
jgi:hypothetical protein